MSAERRAFERKPASVKIDFHCCVKGCSGITNNISANGMFIKTRETCFPTHTPFDIFYASNGRTLQIPVKLSRLVMSEHDYGLGISFVKAN